MHVRASATATQHDRAAWRKRKRVGVRTEELNTPGLASRVRLHDHLATLAERWVLLSRGPASPVASAAVARQARYEPTQCQRATRASPRPTKERERTLRG